MAIKVDWNAVGHCCCGCDGPTLFCDSAAAHKSKCTNLPDFLDTIPHEYYFTMTEVTTDDGGTQTWTFPQGDGEYSVTTTTTRSGSFTYTTTIDPTTCDVTVVCSGGIDQIVTCSTSDGCSDEALTHIVCTDDPLYGSGPGYGDGQQPIETGPDCHGLSADGDCVFVGGVDYPPFYNYTVVTTPTKDVKTVTTTVAAIDVDTAPSVVIAGSGAIITTDVYTLTDPYTTADLESDTVSAMGDYDGVYNTVDDTCFAYRYLSAEEVYYSIQKFEYYLSVTVSSITGYFKMSWEENTYALDGTGAITSTLLSSNPIIWALPDGHSVGDVVNTDVHILDVPTTNCKTIIENIWWTCVKDEDPTGFDEP